MKTKLTANQVATINSCPAKDPKFLESAYKFSGRKLVATVWLPVREDRENPFFDVDASWAKMFNGEMNPNCPWNPVALQLDPADVASAIEFWGREQSGMCRVTYALKDS